MIISSLSILLTYLIRNILTKHSWELTSAVRPYPTTSHDEADGVDGYPYHKYPSIKIARLGFRVVERYKQADFPKMYIDMQPVVERMKPEESLEDFVG